VRLTRAARALGATRLAAITPYFVPAGPRRLLEHYEAVASAADGADVYVYAFPRLAATEVPPDTLSVLARIENVVGVKVSGAPLDLVRAYVDAVPAEFEVWSGDDATLPEVVALGGAGVVSGVSGAFPERFAALTSALRAGAGADQAQAAVLEVVASLRGDIGRIKTVLGLRGLPAGECRLAVDPPDTDEVAQLARLVADDTASARHRSPSGAGVPA
jgi:4-hydroxy-tetrahydrodipicolinate synthase